MNLYLPYNEELEKRVESLVDRILDVAHPMPLQRFEDAVQMAIALLNAPQRGHLYGELDIPIIFYPTTRALWTVGLLMRSLHDRRKESRCPNV